MPDTPAETATAPAARWQQIAQALRDELRAGTLQPGQRLPNEAMLAQRFAVHRHTLRQAVRQLVQEGHLRVVQGSGTYVRPVVLDYALQRRTRLTDNLAQAGERARRELLGHAVAPAGPWGAALGLRSGATVQLLHTRAVVRGRPIGLSTTAYPLPRCAGIAEAFARAGSISAALAAVGVADYARARSAVSCRLPTADEADALARPASAPVLVVQFHSVDSAGVPVEAGRTLFAADAVQLTVDHGP